MKLPEGPRATPAKHFRLEDFKQQLGGVFLRHGNRIATSARVAQSPSN